MAKISNQAQVTSRYSLPDGTQKSNSVESNETQTENLTTSFLKQRTTSSEYGVPNGEIQQTLTLTNLTDQEISNIKIMDTIGTGASFEFGTLTIDGVAYPQYEADSFTLPSPLDAGESVVVSYTIKIDENVGVSSISTVSNIRYDFVERTGISENSNRVTISIVNNKITITKTCSEEAVVSGDVVSYTNIVENNGTVANSNLVFKDELPPEVEFVAGSVLIDGTLWAAYNPTTGFALRDLDSGNSTTITFDVKIL